MECDNLRNADDFALVWMEICDLNDHVPPHVHGPGWVVVVNLLDLQVRNTIRCQKHQADEVLRVIAKNREVLLAGWREIHG